MICRPLRAFRPHVHSRATRCVRRPGGDAGNHAYVEEVSNLEIYGTVETQKRMGSAKLLGLLCVSNEVKHIARWCQIGGGGGEGVCEEMRAITPMLRKRLFLIFGSRYV